VPAGDRTPHREWVGSTDTFFVGSHHPEAGADASHRGGDPGFLDVAGDAVVSPDSPGHSVFCTLGNVKSNPRVGLLFVDFETDRTLQVTGGGPIVRDEERVDAYEGAERLFEVAAERAVDPEDGTPLRWSLDAHSPPNP